MVLDLAYTLKVFIRKREHAFIFFKMVLLSKRKFMKSKRSYPGEILM